MITDPSLLLRKTKEGLVLNTRSPFEGLGVSGVDVYGVEMEGRLAT